MNLSRKLGFFVSIAYVEEEIPAEFVSVINNKKSKGIVVLRKYDEKERMNGAACLIGAAASAFLPLLHSYWCQDLLSLQSSWL